MLIYQVFIRCRWWRIAYVPAGTEFLIHPINRNQIFDPYRWGRITYTPARIRRINHLPMIIGIRGAYAIRPYTHHLILAEDRIQ